MEAKDTVMTWKQQVECSHNPNLELRERDMCLAQAKITFPLGEQQGIEKGRKEVADFIHLNFLEGEDRDIKQRTRTTPRPSIGTMR